MLHGYNCTEGSPSLLHANFLHHMYDRVHNLMTICWHLWDGNENPLWEKKSDPRDVTPGNTEILQGWITVKMSECLE